MTTKSTWWESNRQRAGRALSVFALVAVAMTGLAAAGGARADEAVPLTPFSSAQGSQAPAPWRFTTLPNKAPTRFEVMELGGQRVLKVEADQSYGNLVHRVHVPLSRETSLAWRWRVDQLVEGADLRTRAGDDGAAKLCVFFNLPASQLSVTERAQLKLARAVSGEDVPTEILCYVWDIKEPKGSQFVNAFTNRMQMLVLESGPTSAAGGWVSEKRNVLEDFRRAFGREAGTTVPDVAAVAVAVVLGYGAVVWRGIASGRLRALGIASGAGASGCTDAPARARTGSSCRSSSGSPRCACSPRASGPCRRAPTDRRAATSRCAR